ncbi:MAG: prohibitin family protein [Clostridia bacterium]|nr:prohibitin family protein [Clostridia bacterium]
MFLFILGVLIGIVSFVALGFNRKNKEMGWRINFKQAFSLIGVAFIVLSCIRTVPTGHTGVVTVFGTVQNGTLDAGIHFVAPWKKVINMDNRIQKVSGDMSGTTSDMQDVYTTFTLNYQISKADASTIYRTIGTDYEAKVIEAQTRNTVKAVLAKYAATELVTNRSEVASAIEKELENVLNKYNIEVVDTAIENLTFSDEFNDSIEQKVIAEQNLERAKTEQEKLNLEVQQEAQRKITAANGTAEANKILADSINDTILQKNIIEKWNGELPKVVGNDTNVFDISEYVK